MLKLGLSVLPAILIGAFVAHSYGVSFLTFAPNIAAVLIGFLLLFTINTRPTFFIKNAFGVSLIALFIIFLSLFSTGLDSVHRWIAIGPMFLNVSMPLTPLILYGIAYSEGVRPLILSMFISIIYILQPDAGQATAFSFAAAVIFLFNHRLRQNIRIGGTVLVLSLAAFAWKMPDPLLPVQHVERILHLAFNQGMFIFTIAIISISLLFLPFVKPFLEKQKPSALLLPLSFSTYFLMTFVVTELGNNPVPVIGAGAAPILGWFIMVSFLDVRLSSPAA